VLQFVGFLAAFRAPGALPPLLAGVLGGLLTTWVTFAPCFLWVFAGAPFIEALRGVRALGAALSAISSAVVGVILNLTVWLAIHTLFVRRFPSTASTRRCSQAPTCPPSRWRWARRRSCSGRARARRRRWRFPLLRGRRWRRPDTPALRAEAAPVYSSALFKQTRQEPPMSVDQATVRRIARLARIAVDESEIPHLQGEINAILSFVEELSAVNVEGVEAMTSVIPMKLPMREDVVTDGEIAGKVLANAPLTEDGFFLVPKVVE
jgi:aspartyl/glutamyl-tRNA(Asn/Gln) amidotransferase C subunit